MHKITAAQFKAAVKLDPAWASKLTDPVEITDFCDMSRSKITHLSPLLHFTGRNEDGWSAYFGHCKSLKIAEGNFAGQVSFNASNISRIGVLSCGTNKHGISASFQECKYLKVAEGKYLGYVDFSDSGVQKIENLDCGRDRLGRSANFRGCRALKVATGSYPGSVNFSHTGIENIGDLFCGKDHTGNSVSFQNSLVKIAKGDFKGSANFNNTPIEEIGELTCTADNSGARLSIQMCIRLKKIPLEFKPKELRYSGILYHTILIEDLEKNHTREAAKKALQHEIVTI